MSVPVWMKPLAHGRVLMSLFFAKIFANAVLIAALLAFVAFMRGGAPSWPNVLAVIIGYMAAFMVNFYLQFARYRDAGPKLKSDHAANFDELVAALREDYRDMERMNTSGRQ